MNDEEIRTVKSLQDELIKQGKSSRVICTQQDQRIYI